MIDQELAMFSMLAFLFYTKVFKGCERMKVLTVSGCKPMELNIFSEDDSRIEFIKEAIRKRLISFIEEGLEWVLISGQMGVEMWTAEVVLDLKNTYEIKIGMIPPFENLASRWPEVLQHKYEELSFTVDFFESIYQGDYKGPFQFRARDLWMIDKSDACLLLMDEEYPHSVGYFYDVAKDAVNYPVYMITPDDLEDVVQEIQMQDPDFWGH